MSLPLIRQRLALLSLEIPAFFARWGHFSKDSITEKSPFDFVTEADLRIEEALAAHIHAHFPEDGILGEENGTKGGQNGFVWTLDPIDGSCNLASGLPFYGVQVALRRDGVTEAAVIYLPVFGKLYTALRGEGAFLDGRPLRVNPPTLSRAIVSFGDFPHHKRPREAFAEHKIQARLGTRISKIRMFGAACFDFAALAEGQTGGTVIFTRNLWDLAPGILLAKEAGAQVYGLRDGRIVPYTEDSPVVLAAAGEELLSCLKDCCADLWQLLQTDPAAE